MFWPDNIVELFHRFGVLKHFDFLSVDMDSYDWFTLEKVLEAGFEPRVIIMECNTMFDLEDSKAILPPILPGQTWKMWDGTTYQVGGPALIGRDPSRLCSDWLDHDFPVSCSLLCHKDTAQGSISLCLYDIREASMHGKDLL